MMRFGHGELHLVLLALLSQRPMHGYELMSDLSRRLGRRYRASPGSIYPAIQALESEGLITGEDDGDRRVFSVTQEGTDALERRAHRLAAFEERTGVHFSSTIDSSIARFTARIKEASQRLDHDALDEVLQRTAREIESMANEGGKRD